MSDEVPSSYFEAAARVADVARVLTERWLALRSSGTYPQDVGFYDLISSKGEFKRRFRNIEQICNNLITMTRMQWKDSIGEVALTDRFSIEVIRPAGDRLEKACPSSLLLDRAVEPVIFTIQNLVINEAAAGVKSALGAHVIAAFPHLGIPCGWDEGAGILSLYQPEIKMGS